MGRSALSPAVLNKVPPFPAVAAKLLGVLANPAADTDEIAELISSDATLAAQILKSVNSYQYGLKSEVRSVQQAVALLGLDNIRKITTATATATYVKRFMTAELLSCWQHSIATAVLSEVVAESCHAFENLAYVAGILHDVGRLALLVAYPEEYRKLMRSAREGSIDLLDEEERKFGMNHAEAGRLLAQTWGLPEEFRIVNGRHHDSCDGSEMDLLRIVHFGCRLACSLGFGALSGSAPAAASVFSELPPRVAASMKQTPDELTALIEQRISEVT